MALTLRAYIVLSFVAGAACVFNAYQRRNQFYPTVVHLTSSKISAVTLANVACAFALSIAAMFKGLFFGRFHHSEVEKVYERAWYAVTETLLAITVFREEFDFPFVAQFGLLFIFKLAHWFLEGRLELLENTHEVRLLTVTRMFSLKSVLVVVDAVSFYHHVTHVLEFGPTVKLLFAFEYGILFLTVVMVSAKHKIFLLDHLLTGGRWESRALVCMYLDLLSDLLHVIAYSGFFFAIYTYYGIPIHILRDVYVRVRSFLTRCSDFVNYRRAVERLRTQFADVTPEELAAMGEDKCAICFEDMTTTSKRLPCGHCFHFNCLQGWLEQRQVCPVCNANVLDENTTPVGDRGAHLRNQQQQQEQEQQQQDQEGAVVENEGVGVDPDQEQHVSFSQHQQDSGVYDEDDDDNNNNQSQRKMSSLNLDPASPSPSPVLLAAAARFAQQQQQQDDDGDASARDSSTTATATTPMMMMNNNNNSNSNSGDNDTAAVFQQQQQEAMSLAQQQASQYLASLPPLPGLPQHLVEQQQQTGAEIDLSHYYIHLYYANYLQIMLGMSLQQNTAQQQQQQQQPQQRQQQGPSRTPTQ